MKKTSEIILEIINDIDEKEEAGLLGFCVREIDDVNYEETGNGIIYMFDKYPEHALLLEEFISRVFCMNLDDIVNKMDRERDYYNWL